MKIATYNVNSIRVRLDAVMEWLDKNKPDVLCIQETKCQDDVFPALVLQSSGYHLHYRGMKSYNGVAVLTRTAPDAVFYGFDDQLPEIDDARLMRVMVGGIPIINTYVPNGYKLGTPQYDYKLRWYGRLRNYFASHLSPDQPALWCGDMNVAPEPIDVHSPEKHLRHVCFHEDVRQAYKETLSWGFEDVFRKLYPESSSSRFGTISAKFTREEQGLEDRSHPRDGSLSIKMHGRGRRYGTQTCNEGFRPYVFVGGI